MKPETYINFFQKKLMSLISASYGVVVLAWHTSVWESLIKAGIFENSLPTVNADFTEPCRRMGNPGMGIICGVGQGLGIMVRLWCCDPVPAATDKVYSKLHVCSFYRNDTRNRAEEPGCILLSVARMFWIQPCWFRGKVATKTWRDLCITSSFVLFLCQIQILILKTEYIFFRLKCLTALNLNRTEFYAEVSVYIWGICRKTHGVIFYER